MPVKTSVKCRCFSLYGQKHQQSPCCVSLTLSLALNLLPIKYTESCPGTEIETEIEIYLKVIHGTNKAQLYKIIAKDLSFRVFITIGSLLFFPTQLTFTSSFPYSHIGVELSSFFRYVESTVPVQHGEDVS